MSKNCPTCGTVMEHSRFSYHPPKDSVFLDEDKTVTVDEYECPKCGHFDHYEQTT